MKEIVWSHSKLNTCLTCPMTYNVVYNHKISPKFEKPALSLGSAVHWGIEHSTSDLEEYCKESNFNNKDERIIAESMISGYLKYKDELLDEILYDKNLGKRLDILLEEHELKLYGKLKSNIVDFQKFIGIIDYLLLTNKGYIVIDFKTSSSIPEWENYLDQLYRYIFLLKENFPSIPIYKLAIINLRKCKVKRKSGENDSSFRKRLDVIYQLNDEKHIDIHTYKTSELNVKDIDSYISNLSNQCDAALSIVNSNSYYINYKALNDYGGSSFKELLLNNEGAYTLYNVKDTCYNELTNTIEDFRDMREIDLQKLLYNREVINKYSDFIIEVKNFEEKFEINHKDYKEEDYLDFILNYLKILYYNIDEKLIELYVKTYYIKCN